MPVHCTPNILQKGEIEDVPSFLITWMSAGLFVVGIPDHPVFSTAGTLHLTLPGCYFQTILAYQNRRWELLLWESFCLWTSTSLLILSYLNVITFESDCQRNISGNLFCLFCHSLLRYSWALVGYVVITSPYASCSKQSCFPHHFSF